MTGTAFDLDPCRNAVHALGVTPIQWRLPCLDGKSQSIGHGVAIVTASRTGKRDRLRAVCTSWPLLATSGLSSGEGCASAEADNKSDAFPSRTTFEGSGQP